MTTTTIKLTDAQFNLLFGIAHSQYRDGEEGPDGSTYAWDACDTGGIDEAARGGVIAKAIEAGLVNHTQAWERINGRKTDVSVISFTQLGWDSYLAHQANEAKAEAREERALETDSEPVKHNTKKFNLNDSVGLVSVYTDGQIIVTWNGKQADAMTVDEVKAAIRSTFGLNGPHLALVFKWVTVAAREWAAWRLAQG